MIYDMIFPSTPAPCAVQQQPQFRLPTTAHRTTTSTCIDTAIKKHTLAILLLHKWKR